MTHYLTKVTLENSPPFNSFEEIDLTYDNLNPAMWVIIIGPSMDNSKYILLKALYDKANNKLTVRQRVDKAMGENYIEREVYYFDEFPIGSRNDIQARYAFIPIRLFDNEGAAHNSLQSFIHNFLNAAHNPKSCEDKKKLGKIFCNFVAKLLDIPPKSINYLGPRLDFAGIDVKRDWGLQIKMDYRTDYLDQMYDLHQICAMFIDIFLKKIEKNGVDYEKPSVVFINRLGDRIPPQLQRKVKTLFKKFFRETQFISVTDSLYITQDSIGKKERIIHLRRDGQDDVYMHDFQGFHQGMELNNISAELFDIYYKSPTISKVLKKMRTTLEKSYPTETDKVTRKRRNNNLGNLFLNMDVKNDQEVRDREAMDIINRAAQAIKNKEETPEAEKLFDQAIEIIMNEEK